MTDLRLLHTFYSHTRHRQSQNINTHRQMHTRDMTDKTKWWKDQWTHKTTHTLTQCSSSTPNTHTQPSGSTGGRCWCFLPGHLSVTKWLADWWLMGNGPAACWGMSWWQADLPPCFDWLLPCRTAIERKENTDAKWLNNIKMKRNITAVRLKECEETFGDLWAQQWHIISLLSLLGERAVAYIHIQKTWGNIIIHLKSCFSAHEVHVHPIINFFREISCSFVAVCCRVGSIHFILLPGADGSNADESDESVKG